MSKKISLEDAIDFVAEGEKLNICCDEFKNLRNALRMTRGWANRFKKINLDYAETFFKEIRELISEHDALLITVPIELSQLKQAVCSYCICRRPTEGLMIGCDECDEWYHAPCIGLSPAHIEKVNKYICVRCCVKKVYKTSSDSVALVIRKWCDSKELVKARLHVGQKHQRKVREKKREIVKLEEESQRYSRDLEKLRKNRKKNCLPKVNKLSPEVIQSCQESLSETESTISCTKSIPLQIQENFINQEISSKENGEYTKVDRNMMLFFYYCFNRYEI